MTEDDALAFINDTANVHEISPLDIEPSAIPKKEDKQKENEEKKKKDDQEEKKKERNEDKKRKKKTDDVADHSGARKLNYDVLCRCGLSCVSRQANNSDVCDETALELYKLALKN